MNKIQKIMNILLQAHTTIHQSLQKYIYIYIYIFVYIYLTELLSTGHPSTSRTPPHTHTSPPASLNFERLPFNLQHQEIQNMRNI